MNMKRKIDGFFIGLMVLCIVSVPGRFGHGESNKIGVLATYIEMGLKSNLALKQQEFSLGKSLQALREARGMFLPSVSIEARCSRAGGGRVFDVPVGDLVNPVHLTLNQLLMLHGFTPLYPGNIANERIPFLRETEHETKIRVVQPIFQPALYYNLKIKKDLTGIQRARLNVFKRQLAADIKSGYFTYLKTVKAKQLLDNTRELQQESLRVSESLFRHHKVTEEVVFRSEAELSQLEQQRAEAEKDLHLAASYFNFLLNRPLQEEIRIEAGDEKPVVEEHQPDLFLSHALQHRGEFLQLQGAIRAAGHTVGLRKSAVLPTVTAVFDYGFQGEKYRFTGDDDYWMGSLLLSWNLFRGGQDAAKKKQALYEKKQLQARYQELENQIRLQVNEAYHNLEVAKKAMISSKNTQKSQKEAFSIISKKYRQGMVPQIEYIKARNDYTNAGIAHIIAIYDYYIKEAQLERVSAMYVLK
jgi:outer membrane protein TolC